MEEKSFRVLLDLTEINSGETDLKYVWIYICPRELKTIYDFKRAILKKFSFSQENFRLFLRDGLLLENEKIGILREDDTVKILYDSNQSLCSGSFKSFDQVSVILPEDKQQDSSLKESKKRKSDVFYSFVEENISPSKHKKKKKCHSFSLNEIDYNDVDLVQSLELSKNSCDNSSRSKKSKQKPNCDKHITEDTAVGNDVKLISSKKSKQKPNCVKDVMKDLAVNNDNDSKLISKNKNTQPDILCNNTYNINLVENGNGLSSEKLEKPLEVNAEAETSQEIIRKKRRRRKRKRKESPNAEGGISLNESEIKSSVDSSSNIKDNTVEDISLDIRKHVIYRSPTPPSQFIETITIDQMSSTQSSDSGKPELFSDTSPLNISSLDSCIKKFLEEENNFESSFLNKCKSVKNKVATQPRISTPFNDKSLQGQSWDVTPLSKITQVVKNKDAQPSTSYGTPLTCVPPIGVHLAFKTLELNENYCPEVTDYKEGILRNINPNTDELEIELIKEEIKPGRVGKFENIKDDEVPAPQIIKMVYLNWSSLIEPRLVSN